MRHSSTFATSLRLLCVLLLDVLLLAGLTRATCAQTGFRPADLLSQTIPSSNLESYLAQDGTLNFPPGFSGSLDARGWALVSGENEPPRFIPSTPGGDVGRIPDDAPRVAGDERWSSEFKPRGVPGVTALVAGAGADVYAGGYFWIAGDAVARHVARWDGSHWTPLGYGFDGGVHTLVWDGARSMLYAGGNFRNICNNAECSTSTRVNHVARWNGTEWSSLTPSTYGVSDTVYALALDPNGNLFIGGGFSYLCTFPDCSASTPANRIARWDRASETMSALSTGIGGGSVYALTWLNWPWVWQGLIVGGFFTSAGGVPVNNLAQWDGATWARFRSGVDGAVMALAVDPVHPLRPLALGGWFDYICDVGAAPPTCNKPAVNRVNHVAAAAIDGYWGPVGNGVLTYYGSTSTVRSLAIDSSSSRMYVGGEIAGLCSDPACGSSSPASNVAVVDYSAFPYTWSALSSGLSEAALALAFQGSALYAGGYLELAGSAPATGIARWTPASSTWSALGVGNGLSGDSSALAVDRNGNVYVGGDFGTAGPVIANNIARWNSATRTWSALGLGIQGLVTALAVDPDGTVYVGGSFKHLCLNQTCASGTQVNNLARWTPGGASGTWSLIDHGIYGKANALALDRDGNLYVAGRVYGRCPDQACAAPEPVHGLLKWTRATGILAPFGASLPDGEEVFALAVDRNSALYVGGEFTDVCANAECSGSLARVNHVSKWTPSGASSGTWSTLGNGVDGRVLGFAVDAKNNLYVAGEFIHTCSVMDACAPAGQVLNRVGMWTPNGSAGTWHSLGNGIYGMVSALAADEYDNIYATGAFSALCQTAMCAVPGTTLNRAAKWNGSMWLPLGSGLILDGYLVQTGVAAKSGVVSFAGLFQVAGGKPSMGFAQYRDDVPMFLPYVVR